jgi:hypothetical protein
MASVEVVVGVVVVGVVVVVVGVVVVVVVVGEAVVVTLVVSEAMLAVSEAVVEPPVKLLTALATGWATLRTLSITGAAFGKICLMTPAICVMIPMIEPRSHPVRVIETINIRQTKAIPLVVLLIFIPLPPFKSSFIWVFQSILRFGHPKGFIFSVRAFFLFLNG